MKETEDEVPEMKDARTLSLSSSTCDPFYHPAISPSLRQFQLEDSLGTKDPATGMILIEYDYLPSSSDRYVHPPPSPLPIPTLPRERNPRAPSSSYGGSGSREFSLRRTDGRTETRARSGERVARFNLRTRGAVLHGISSARWDRQY